MQKEYKIGTRWICDVDNKVWEKRVWGWKFIGIAKSQYPLHILQLRSNDCDHPEDIYEDKE